MLQDDGECMQGEKYNSTVACRLIRCTRSRVADRIDKVGNSQAEKHWGGPTIRECRRSAELGLNWRGPPDTTTGSTAQSFQLDALSGSTSLRVSGSGPRMQRPRCGSLCDIGVSMSVSRGHRRLTTKHYTLYSTRCVTAHCCEFITFRRHRAARVRAAGLSGPVGQGS